MKKQRILAMAMVMGLAGSMTMPVEAAKVYSVGGDESTKGYIIINGQVCNLPEADNEQPEAPEAGRPDEDTNQPEMDNGQPEDNISDSANPGGDTNQPAADDEQQEESAELSYVRQIAKLVNEERAKAGLHPLSFDTEIASAAQIRANEIKTSFSHTRPDGRKFSSVLTDNGIRFTGAGENIAWGQKTPEQVMEAWMNSDGHRANILNAKFTKIGVGQYRNAAGRNYWVQLFTY